MKTDKNLAKDAFFLIAVMIYILSIFLIFNGGIMIALGFHNIDLGHNLNMINQVTDSDWIDYANGGEILTPYDLIDNGFDILFKGIYQAIFGFMLNLIVFTVFYIESRCHR